MHSVIVIGKRIPLGEVRLGGFVHSSLSYQDRRPAPVPISFSPGLRTEKVALSNV